MKPERRRKILEIIRQNPGASGVMIHTKLVKNSWIGQRFGSDSLIAALIGPSFGSMWVHLANMEDEGLIVGQWMEGPYPRRRVYHAV